MKKLSISISLICVFAAFVSVSGDSVSEPLIPVVRKWPMNSYCNQRKVGNSDFYIAARGPYAFSGEEFEAMKSLGLDKIMTPGWVNLWHFRLDDDEKNSYSKRVADIFLENKYPFFSISYHASKEGTPSLTDTEKRNEFWMGDGHPEYCYRFEHFLPAVLDENSTWLPMNNEKYTFLRKYIKKYAVPELEKYLPFYKDKSHKWTRHEYYLLSQIQNDVMYKEVGVGNALPWGMGGQGFYYLASQDGNRAVADKSANYFAVTRYRGAMRQFGGNKFWIVWRGFEPLSVMSPSMAKGRTGPDGVDTEGSGYPYTHCRIYVFEPYLAGCNLYINEGFASSLMDDVENDGHYELSPLGHVVNEMLDFSQRHPERGEVYAPVALLMDWEMTQPTEKGTSYGNYLPFDDSDQMNYGILFDLLFPELPEEGWSYFSTAPFGNIFDLIKPNVPGRGIDPKVFENYKLLFALGGLRIDKDLADKIMKYVSNGGSFVINVEDCGKEFPSDFLGVKIGDEAINVTESISDIDGKRFRDNNFKLRKLILNGAVAIYSDKAGNPVISKFKYGNGYVFVVAAEYMIESAAHKLGDYPKKKILSFTKDFLDHLCSGLMPVDVVIPEQYRNDIGWSVARKGKGWVVKLINYSYKREAEKVVKYATAHIDVLYPGVKIPVKLICRFPVKDVLEWIDDKDLKWTMHNDNVEIDTTLASGEIKVIEIQPEKIQLAPVMRYINYAEDRPVKVTSEEKGHEGRQLVDGNTERGNGWWSKDKKSRFEYALPQTAIVCLEEARSIDHIELLFYYWQRERPEKYGRLRFTQFYVETSLDGTKWEMAFDERKNLKTPFGDSLERWFPPRKAMYVKLIVTGSPIGAGAQVIEMKVFGTEKAPVPIIRKVAEPGRIEFPEAVSNIDPKKISYLYDMKYTSAKTDWLPPGKSIDDMNGRIELKARNDEPGKLFKKSLYAEANSEYLYRLDGNYTHFLAVAGLGAVPKNGGTVHFRVLVDGKEKYKSALFKSGNYPIPVSVNVTGGKELRLIVDDGGDGFINDYAWWGDPRLIKK